MTFRKRPIRERLSAQKIFPGVTAAQLGQPLPDPGRDDPAILLLHLVLDGHGVDARQEALETGEDLVLGLLRHRPPVLGVIALVFAGEVGRAAVPRLEVGRRETAGQGDEPFGPAAEAGAGAFRSS